ncbi:hypothetical protein [Schleiferilactobacillus shenzhenensis]|uniref:Uncharacterized protein n=1 Tax=Schleiferilactobacillus shenzhenensis LY-73 TaxID=1231336 RepID=U4TM61_9LACO|nr:hypothetical protein [Schleiferilactobacillus shenzhenensis]ERL65294.1 hypothetical protein L248_2693 [Schleiferilactobacillus shenzhenensis LY-73]
MSWILLWHHLRRHAVERIAALLLFLLFTLSASNDYVLPWIIQPAVTGEQPLLLNSRLISLIALLLLIQIGVLVPSLFVDDILVRVRIGVVPGHLLFVLGSQLIYVACFVGVSSFRVLPATRWHALLAIIIGLFMLLCINEVLAALFTEAIATGLTFLLSVSTIFLHKGPFLLTAAQLSAQSALYWVQELLWLFFILLLIGACYYLRESI